MTRAITAAIIAVAIVLLATAPASAATVSDWQPVTDRTGSIQDEGGIVRDARGALHLVYVERDGAAIGLRYRTLANGSSTWSAPTKIVSDWIAITDPDIEIVDGVPHVFWGGQSSINPADPSSTGQAWSASLRDRIWTMSAAPMTVQNTPAGSEQVSSAVASDGAPWISWTGTALLVTHAGLALGGAEQNLSEACCQYASNVGRDAATGDLYVTWYSNQSGGRGFYMRRIAPALGDVIALPDRAPADESMERGLRLAAAPRSTGGVYTAYCETYPDCTSIRVAGSSGPSLSYRSRAGDINAPTVWTTAAPQGRMWLLWQNKRGAMFAARSNRALTRWSRPLVLGTPEDTRDIWYAFGDGGRGPLDAFINMSGTDSTRIYHTRVQPDLDLAASTTTIRLAGSSTARTVSFTLTDVGDPVRGRVTYLGRTRSTDAFGRATFVVPPTTRVGAHAAIGRAGGYGEARRATRVILK